MTKLLLHQYLQEEVFRPIGMDRTTLRPSFEDANVSKAYASMENSDAHELHSRQPFAQTVFEASGGA